MLIPVIDPEWPTGLQEEMVLNGGTPTAGDLRALEYAVRYLAAYPWQKPATFTADGDGNILQLATSGSAGDSVEVGVQVMPWATGLEVWILGAAAAVGTFDERMEITVSAGTAEAILQFDTTLVTPSAAHATWQSALLEGVGTGAATDAGAVQVEIENDDTAVAFSVFAVQVRQTRAYALNQ
tara:strand:+ start:596 stop:1141 length:546 start_codon:yes stop_codon:yes gene_type:complete